MWLRQVAAAFLALLGVASMCAFGYALWVHWFVREDAYLSGVDLVTTQVHLEEIIIPFPSGPIHVPAGLMTWGSLILGVFSVVSAVVAWPGKTKGEET